MLTHFTTTLKQASSADLYDITLKSSAAKNKQVFIFEKGDMGDLFAKDKAEQVRQNFINNGIKVKQITNSASLPAFTGNDAFTNQVMTFRYIPKDIFTIANEILLFDDIVAVYNSQELLIIEDQNFALNYRQLFLTLWDQGQSPALGFDYKPNHSFYKNIDYHLDDLQIIVWPDAEAKNAYSNFSQESLGNYIKNVIKSDDDHKKASFAIVFMWAMDGHKMLDVWLFENNYVDERSGPLSNAKIYKDGVICDNLGISSGNTLLVLGYEEKLRRQSKDLQSYLSGPSPLLPLEIMNGQTFF